jgi:hypothetical protein
MVYFQVRAAGALWIPCAEPTDAWAVPPSFVDPPVARASANTAVLMVLTIAVFLLK